MNPLSEYVQVACRSVSGIGGRKVSRTSSVLGALTRSEAEVDDLRFRQQNNLDVYQPRKTRLLKVSAAAVLSSLLVSCGGTAPRPTLARAQSYSVITEQADPLAGTLTISIKVAGPATQSNFKSAAESLIAERKSEYRHITVKSYAENAAASDPPAAISRLENDSVSHVFNARTETERIQTH